MCNRQKENDSKNNIWNTIVKEYVKIHKTWFEFKVPFMHAIFKLHSYIDNEYLFIIQKLS